MGQPGAGADRKGRVADLRKRETGNRKVELWDEWQAPVWETVLLGVRAHAYPVSLSPESAIAIIPPKLTGIVDLFDALSDEEKRENLIAYADRRRAARRGRARSSTLRMCARMRSALTRSASF